MNRPELQKWISAEITAQLKELKEQLNKEMLEDMNKIKKSILSEVAAIMEQKMEQKIKAETHKNVTLACEGVTKSVNKRLDQINNQMIVVSQDQANSSREQTREIVLSMGQQVCDTVYSNVIAEINKELVPKINNMAQWVNYNLQDGNEVVDSYRRAVEYRSSKLDPNLKLLTDGGKDKRVISPHVRTFFADDD